MRWKWVLLLQTNITVPWHVQLFTPIKNTIWHFLYVTEIDHHWFGSGLVACLAPCCSLFEYLLIVNWTLENKFASKCGMITTSYSLLPALQYEVQLSHSCFSGHIDIDSSPPSLAQIYNGNPTYILPALFNSLSLRPISIQKCCLHISQTYGPIVTNTQPNELIGLDNGLFSAWHQAITKANDNLLQIGRLGMKSVILFLLFLYSKCTFNEILCILFWPPCVEMSYNKANLRDLKAATGL